MSDREKPQDSRKMQEDLLDESHPVFKVHVVAIQVSLRATGWQPNIVFAKRTPAQKADAVQREASPSVLSWHVRSSIGLLPVPNVASSIQVVHGNAVDIVDERYFWNGPAADKNYKFWKNLGDAARQGIVNGAVTGHPRLPPTSKARVSRTVETSLMSR
jgi:hypothetical protein